MMSNHIRERIIRDIKKNYVDIARPSFHFKMRNYPLFGYNELIKEFEGAFYTEEIGDINYDVSRSLLLKKNGRLFYVYLSLIGAYCFIMSNGEVISDNKNVTSIVENEIINTIRLFNITILTKEDLLERLPFSIYFEIEEQEIDSVIGLIFAPGLTI